MTRSDFAIGEFIEELATYSADRVFNPWAMNCEDVDGADSFVIRRENLRKVLTACAEASEVDLWIGRDLGWRGGRRTGVALVDETSLIDYARSIAIEDLQKATVGPTMRERTATEIHLARSRVSHRIFFWNVFPFHPHEEGKPQTNRMHTRRERVLGLGFLESVLALLPIGRIVTIGNDAASALQTFGLDCGAVRHPSYGGQKEFHRQINYLYGIHPTESLQPDLFGHEH